MPTITYVEFDGQEHVIDAASGETLLENAKRHDVPGLDADCGGNCSCGTCHVYIDPDWTAPAGARTGLEAAIMGFLQALKPNSRLSCQVEVTDTFDGMIVRLPERQRRI